jgi:hypothetical protein
MVEHVTIQHADCHEPKHITISTTSDAGKVITPSSSTSGVSTLRYLNINEVDSTGIPAGNYLTSDGAGGFTGSVPTNVQATSSLSGSALTVPNGTFVKVPFSSIDFQAGTWSIVSNSLIIPSDGTYRIDYSATVHLTVSSDIGKRTFLLTAGTDSAGPTSASTVSVGEEASTDPDSAYTNISGTVFLTALEEDQVSLYISSDSTDGSVNIHRAVITVTKVL